MKNLLTALITVLCLAACAQGPKILHYSETSGYDHGTRGNSLSMFQLLANDFGATVIDDQNGSEFNSLANLQQYDLVVFSNTSGSSILNPAQRIHFEDYIIQGGSFVGIHAASDTYRHSSANGSSTGSWDWYAENLTGCSVQQSPNHTSQNHIDTIFHMVSHTILDNLPNPWIKTEEYYYWENGYVNQQDFQEILRVGRTGNQSYDSPRMVAQIRDLPGGGKAFYTSLGHARSNFQQGTMFIELIRGALDYILNDEPFGIFQKPDIPSAESLGLEIYLSDNILHIEVPDSLPGYRIDVFNVIGQRLELGPDRSMYLKEGGLYIVKLTFQNGVQVHQKIVKR